MSDETLPTLRFAINLGNAVLASLTPEGQPAGITVELAKDIARYLHCRPLFITYPAAGKVVEDAGQGIWDIAFLAIDPKREDRLRFTAPYITIQGTLLVRDPSNWRSVREMDKPGVVINVGKNAAYDLWLSRELRYATLNRLASSQAAIDAFLAGEGDMAAGIRQPLEAAAQNNPGFRVLPDDFTEIQQAICVAKADDRYFEVISERLVRLREDDTLSTMIAGHIRQ
ncbi:TPA: transporter substrate-binding domain-containing protein [Kluyvera intermedia]|nr:transporter substrate-binding domain-containing protein [Kluyvera intermedia]HAU8268035.1 transporter substrate-binding domain-containing protein [Kluyvera intermedia]